MFTTQQLQSMIPNQQMTRQTPEQIAYGAFISRDLGNS